VNEPLLLSTSVPWDTEVASVADSVSPTLSVSFASTPWAAATVSGTPSVAV
jgi:hypothetical protein